MTIIIINGGIITLYIFINSGFFLWHRSENGENILNSYDFLSRSIANRETAKQTTDS